MHSDEYTAGDAINAAGSQGFANRPSGPVTLRNVGTGGGDYAEGSIDKSVHHHYGDVRPRPVDPATLADAQRLLAALPLDELPVHAPLPHGSVMPLSRNPLFVGRKADLQALAQALRDGGTAAIGQIAAATGLGGIGKTNLATEFVHRYGQFFAGGVFWLSFADPASVPAEVAACDAHGLVAHPNYRNLKLDDQLPLVLAAWQCALPRLLVFDNCEDEALLAQWRPPHGGCRVLITSRRGVWDVALGVQVLPLGALAREESVALLRAFVGDLSNDGVDAIATELGDLPLALHLAGSFLKRYAATSHGNPVAFLERLSDPALLEHPALIGRATGAAWIYHERSIARAFALSYERLDATNATDALALALLAPAACFAPGEPIPRDLLRTTVDPTDELLVTDALERLTALGLLEDDTATGSILHRLLAAFVLTVASDEETQGAVEQAMIKRAYNLNEQGIPEPLLSLQAHLRHITDVALAREDERAAGLATNLGYHLNMIGDYVGARPYLERALAISEQTLGPEHPATATSLNNLGLLLHNLGDLARARPYLERALAISEQVLGPDHPDTALSLNNLGMLLQMQGNLAGARPYLERALAISEQVLGPDHPDTALSLNNLGMLLRDLGDLVGAWLYYKRALVVHKQVLGPQHPDTALSLNNLGMLLQMQGNLAGARPYLERALNIREAVLGSEHPDTALSLNNLGMLLRDLGDLVGARHLHERALAIYEQTLGPDHLDTALSLNNLAILCYDEANFSEAAHLMRQALVICERALGPQHPHTQSSRQLLEVIAARLSEGAEG